MNARLVLDVSNNRTIDEQTLRRLGAAGLYAKCTEGSSFVDDTYAQHRHAAKSAGIPFGAYLFLHPTSTSSQADFFLEHARPEAKDLQPVIDCEVTDGEPWPRVAERCQACASRLEQRGYRPLLYSSASFLQSLFAVQPTLRRLRLWEAQYPGAYRFWDPALARLRWKLGHGAAVVLWQWTNQYAGRYDASRSLVPLNTLRIPPQH